MPGRLLRRGRAPFQRAVRRAAAALVSSDTGRRLVVATQDALDVRTMIATPHGPLSLRLGSDIERYRIQSFWDKEPETIAWIDATCGPDTVFYDVGANIGVYTLYALVTGGPSARAVCFEPSALNFPRLCLNLADNGLDGRADAIAVGLGDARSLVTFHLSDLQPGAALHHYGDGDHTTLTHLVPIVRLDELVAGADLPTPTHLKVDVDGPELAVLRGAAAILRQRELRHVLVEAPEEDEPAVDELVLGAGFALVTTGASHAGTRNRIFRRADP